MLAEHRHRQPGDKQRRDKKDRVGISQRQPAHGIDEAAEHDEREHTTAKMQAPAHRTQLAPAAGVCEQHQQVWQRSGAAQCSHFQRRIARRKQLEYRIHAGKEGHGKQHRSDAAQSLVIHDVDRQSPIRSTPADMAPAEGS